MKNLAGEDRLCRVVEIFERLQEVGLSLPKWRHRKVASLAGIAAAIGVALAACALPAAGPTVDQLEHPFDGPTFTLVKVDSRIIQILRERWKPGFGRRFHRTSSAAASNVLRPGDAVAITVYETGGSPLFSSGPTVPGATAIQPGQLPQGMVPAGVTTVPPQVIETDGSITMPFVGRVTAPRRRPRAQSFSERGGMTRVRARTA
jgi:polysaccharide export outer membrane protein